VNDFIKDVSLGVKTMADLVESKQYDLVSEDLIIPPQQWQTLIRPGALVTIRDRNDPSASPVGKAKTPKKRSWLRRSTSRTGKEEEMDTKR
jgi:hypothetical protein